MTEQNIGDNTGATEATGTNTQAARTYSQEEFDSHMARMKSSLTNKLTKQYEDLGSIDELRSMREDANKRATEQQLKRGEFDKTIQELAQKKDAEIQKRDAIIKDYKVNTPLVSAAAKFRSVNPDQVKSLLINNVRLNGEGDVEVVDAKGTVRYNDGGVPLQVEDLVREFLDSNPHFVSAGASTTNTKTNTGNGNVAQFDLSKLDMSNPAHRKQYAAARKAGQA